MRTPPPTSCSFTASNGVATLQIVGGGVTQLELEGPAGRDRFGRDFGPDARNRVWAADIKQIKTGEGWL